MKARVYVLSFSLGLGLGTTTLLTSDPFGTVWKLAAEGQRPEHVTIRSANGAQSAATGLAKAEQEWKFMEWS